MARPMIGTFCYKDLDPIALFEMINERGNKLESLLATANYESIFGAIQCERLDSIKYWIRMGHVNVHHPVHNNPLDYAISKNYPEGVRCILENGGRSQSLCNILHIAVGTHGDDITILNLLFQYNYRTFSINPLISVCECNYTNKLRFLLENFELSVNECKLYPPLYYAIKNNNIEATLLLLDHGADLNIIVEDHISIIDYTRWKQRTMYKVIIEHRYAITKPACR